MISGLQGSQAPTFGQIFTDGSILELVADSAKAGGLSVLLWDGALVRIAQQIEHKGQIYRPAELDPTIIDAIRFPNCCASYGSTRELWEGVSGVIKNFTGLPDRLVWLASASVFASWNVDFTPNPVCLSIFGPRSRQVPQLLQILGSLYRRALSLGAIGLAAICALPMVLRPALLIDSGELDPPLLKLLRATSTRDTFVPINGEARSVYCAKAIYTQEPIVDATLIHTVLPIPITPTSRSLPILDNRIQQQIADEFQPKLLQYRLSNLQRVRDSDFDATKFDTPVRDLARSLGACVIDDEGLQARVVGLLLEHEDRHRVARSTDLNAVVIEAMLFFCHEEKQTSVHVGEIADVVNTILEGRGEALELKPKSVAGKLRNFGIVPERLDAAGRGIVLLNETRERIHNLARDLDVPTVRSGAKGCKQCRGTAESVDSKTEE
jgi:hypothetical protein